MASVPGIFALGLSWYPSCVLPFVVSTDPFVLSTQSGRVQKHNPPVWGEGGDSQPGSQGPGHDGSYPLWPN